MGVAPAQMRVQRPGERRGWRRDQPRSTVGHLAGRSTTCRTVAIVCLRGSSRGTWGYCGAVRLALPAPSDLLGLPGLIVDSIRELGDSLSRAEALLPRVDDIVTRAKALLDQAAPVVARAAPAGPQVIDTASRVLQRVADVLTPERTAALGSLISRLDAALTPGRVEGAAQALDALQSRADVLPRALDGVDDLLSSGRLDRLGTALDRLLSDGRLDQLLDLATDERADRLLSLAVDGRIDRLLDQLDVLLVDDRAQRMLDRADEVLRDERLSRLADSLDRLLAEDHLTQVEEVLSDGRPAAAMRVLVRLDRGLSDAGAEALTTLLDRLPVLLTEDRTALLAALADQAPRFLRALDSGELPSSRELGQLPPDLHAVLEVLDDLHQVVSGMPGAGLARDRGDEPHPQVEDPHPQV
jgi:hypothetical protein